MFEDFDEITTDLNVRVRIKHNFVKASTEFREVYEYWLHFEEIFLEYQLNQHVNLLTQRLTTF